MNFIAQKINSVTAQEVWFTESKIQVLLTDGRELGIPLEWFPKLRDCLEPQRQNWRLIGNGIGIHWPELDEDLSVKGLL